MRVRIPGSSLSSLQVGEHVLRFGPDGWAEADHLTDEEVQRCVSFHFRLDRGVAVPATASSASLRTVEEASPSATTAPYRYPAAEPAVSEPPGAAVPTPEEEAGEPDYRDSDAPEKATPGTAAHKDASRHRAPPRKTASARKPQKSRKRR